MKWQNILKNDYMEKEIDNVMKLIKEFDIELVNAEEKFTNMLEDIRDVAANLDNGDVDDEAENLLKTDIGRFFLDASFEKLEDAMRTAYNESMEADEEETRNQKFRDENEEELGDLDEFFNKVEDMIPELEKEGGEFFGLMIKDYINQARSNPRQAQRLARAVKAQIEMHNRVHNTDFKV